MPTTKKTVKKKAAPPAKARKMLAPKATRRKVTKAPVKKPAKRSKPLFPAATMALFKKACNALNLDWEAAIPKVGGMPSDDQKSVIAYAMLVIIIKHVNAGWKKDYHEPNYGYWTWHRVKADAQRPSGFGFSYSFASYDGTGTDVGSRLCFQSQAQEREYAPVLDELYVAYKL
jgi:hypothetical protein